MEILEWKNIDGVFELLLYVERNKQKTKLAILVWLVLLLFKLYLYIYQLIANIANIAILAISANIANCIFIRQLYSSFNNLLSYLFIFD